MPPVGEGSAFGDSCPSGRGYVPRFVRPLIAGILSTLKQEGKRLVRVTDRPRAKVCSESTLAAFLGRSGLLPPE
jgi:hypothetical protein